MNVLLLLALACFVVAVFWTPPRLNLIALGLAFWVLNALGVALVIPR